MGIKQLFQIVKEEAPDAVKEGDIKNQFGRKVAIVGSALDDFSRSPHDCPLTNHDHDSLRAIELFERTIVI